MTSMEMSSYLMSGFYLLQNLVVTNLLHVMKLLDLNTKQNHKLYIQQLDTDI